jgi:hypothetical protein
VQHIQKKMKRTKWIIYQPDDEQTRFCVKTEQEIENIHLIGATVIDDDDGKNNVFSPMKIVSRNHIAEIDTKLSMEQDSKYFNYIKPRAFQNMNDKQLLLRIESLYLKQQEFVFSENYQDYNKNNIWLSFKQQPIKLLKKSKAAIKELYPSESELSKEKEESAKEKKLGFKRINASFSLSLRNHRKKLVNNTLSKRKKNSPSSDNSSSSSDSEKEDRFASCVVNFEDLIKTGNNKQ